MAVVTESKARKKKLTLSVSADVSDILDEMAEKKGITVTELIRRSIATQWMIDRALEEHGDMVLATKDDRDVVNTFLARI